MKRIFVLFSVRPHPVTTLFWLLVCVHGLVLGPFEATAQGEIWYNISELPLEGKGWENTQDRYGRLPSSSAAIVGTDMWHESRDSAGLRVRFVTSGGYIKARWTLQKQYQLALPEMPAAGVSGLDLYARDEGKWFWVASGIPTTGFLNEVTMVSGLDYGAREFMLYLPVHNGVRSVEVGLPKGSTFLPAPDRYSARPPIVFFGSGIVQGRNVFRAGMAYPSIIGRYLDWPVVNLGFATAGRIETEIADLLSEINASVFVVDTLPNLTLEQVRDQMEPFLETLRTKHPQTPIVLVENIQYPNASFIEALHTQANEGNALLRDIYNTRETEGDKKLYYIPASRLLGIDGEDTVDGRHVSDLGSMRIAEAIGPVIRKALTDDGWSIGLVPPSLRLTLREEAQSPSGLLSWDTLPGQVYDLQGSDDLITWQSLPGFPVTSTENSLSHTIFFENSRQFFRVILRE